MKPIAHVFSRPARLSLVLACTVGLAATHSLPAQPSRPEAGWSQRLHAGVVHQLDADIDGGGEVGVTRGFVGADFSRTLSADTTLGFGLGAGLDAYDFSQVAAPWSDITRFDASVSYMRLLNREWALRVTPSVQISGEKGASTRDSMVFGLMASGTRAINPDLRLGLGFAAFTGLEETRAFPFIAVQWKISETWSLQNPFRPGPAGPAGVEIVRKGEVWELSWGVAYRSYRFRLAEDNLISEGIGEYRGVPLFMRASRSLDKNWQVDLYAGLLVAGRLELESRSGRSLGKTDVDPAPLAAFTLNGRF